MICLCIPLNPYGWHVLFRSLPIQPPFGFCMHNFEHPLYHLQKCFADIFNPMLTSYCKKKHTDKLLLICIILLYKPPIKETMIMGIVRRWPSHVTNFNHDIHNTYSVKETLHCSPCILVSAKVGPLWQYHWNTGKIWVNNFVPRYLKANFVCLCKISSNVLSEKSRVD